MGSVPDYVLAAFSALAEPQLSEDAPTLPSPVVEAWDMWAPDWPEMGLPEGHGDPFEHEPWRHDWASRVSGAMGVTTTPHGRLTWSAMGRWNLDCRFSWKTLPDSASEALSWLAPYVDRGFREGRMLVGYAHHDAAPRPHLFWVHQGQWELEDLNPDDEWTWG